jgi:hypothetical protein
VLHWPIRIIRIVTDPVVDSIFLVISYLVLPSIVRLLDGFFIATYLALSAVVPADTLETSARFVRTTVSSPLLSLCYFTECVPEREYYEFSLGYSKQLHRHSYFKTHTRGTLQLDPVHRDSFPRDKIPDHCAGGTLLRSLKQTGQIEFIPGRDWLDSNDSR